MQIFMTMMVRIFVGIWVTKNRFMASKIMRVQIMMLVMIVIMIVRRFRRPGVILIMTMVTMMTNLIMMS